MEHLSEKKCHTCFHKRCLRSDCKGTCVWIKSLKYKSINQILVYHLNDWLMVMADDCWALMPEALSGIKAVFCLIDKEQILQSIDENQCEVFSLFLAYILSWDRNGICLLCTTPWWEWFPGSRAVSHDHFSTGWAAFFSLVCIVLKRQRLWL